jgi:hypothetical protein
MTAVEKANDLVIKFGKEVALKVVDEILKSNPCYEGTDRGGDFMWVEDTYYWEQVKHELNKSYC